jgi:hypothetical protein
MTHQHYCVIQCHEDNCLTIQFKFIQFQVHVQVQVHSVSSSVSKRFAPSSFSFIQSSFKVHSVLFKVHLISSHSTSKDFKWFSFKWFQVIHLQVVSSDSASRDFKCFNFKRFQVIQLQVIRLWKHKSPGHTRSNTHDSPCFPTKKNTSVRHIMHNKTGASRAHHTQWNPWYHTVLQLQVISSDSTSRDFQMIQLQVISSGSTSRDFKWFSFKWFSFK